MILSLQKLFANIFHVISVGIQDGGSLHPIVVHFPLVLLFIVPAFIVAGLIWKSSQRTFFITALVLLILGTASLFIATRTGDMASEHLEPVSREMVRTLDTHLRLAERCRLVFSVLTILFSFWLFWGDRFLSKISPRIFLLFFLSVYSFYLVVLINTAHYGGQLVHKHHIHSTLYSDPSSP